MTRPRSYDPTPEPSYLFWLRLLCILLPHHLHQRHKAMSTSSPQRRLTAAEMYFYTELRSSLGQTVADQWLSGTSSSCAGSCRVSSFANTPTAELPTERRKNGKLKKSPSIHDSRSHSQASSLISAADTPRSVIFFNFCVSETLWLSRGFLNIRKTLLGC